VLAYNGFHAVVMHRFCHWLWGFKLRVLSRVLANISRMFTGVEIHPGATIGENLFIDHGMGIVIGETAVIGDNVTIYHGVTLGGVGRTGEVHGKRHPTIEDNVIIGAGAQIIGNITVETCAKVGANSVVIRDVNAHTTVLGSPARIVGNDERARPYGLPSLNELHTLTGTIDCLMGEMERIKGELNLDGKDCSESSESKNTNTTQPSNTE